MIERPEQQPPTDERHPDEQDPPEDTDECPAAAELGHAVGDALAQRHGRFVFLLDHAADTPAPRDLRDQRFLHLRDLLVLPLEIPQKLLGPELLVAVRADAALRIPLRAVAFDDVENLVFQLLRGDELATVDRRPAQRAVELGHERPLWGRLNNTRAPGNSQARLVLSADLQSSVPRSISAAIVK